MAEREGWNVKTCTNGLELLNAIKLSDGPGLLLVDVNMPEMDGIEAIKALVHIGRPLRIHFMTGGPCSTIEAAETIAKGHGLAVGGSIFKPISVQALIALLRNEALHMSD